MGIGKDIHISKALADEEPEVEGHAIKPASAAEPEGDDDEPEVEGHLLPNPYLMANSADQRRDEALRAAERDRQAKGQDTRGLVDRVRDRVQGRDDG